MKSSATLEPILQRREPTLPKLNYFHPFQDNSSSSIKSFKIAIGFEDGNLAIYDSDLTLLNKINTQQSIICIKFICDFLATSSAEELKVWSKKKGEAVASKKCSISGELGVFLNIPESTDWSDDIIDDKNISLYNIDKIIIGNENGIDLWRPTERTKSGFYRNLNPVR